MAETHRLRYNGLDSVTLGAAISSSGATSITFAAALQSMGANIPTLATDQYLPLVIDNEILYLTAYTAAATTGTISRGKEGTTAATHSNGANVVHGPMVADFSSSRLWTPEKPHAQNDEFRSGVLDSAWVNVAGSGGTYTWTVGGDCLSLYQVGSGNQNLWAKVKPYNLAVGEGIQIHATALSPVLSAYPMAGPVISDGATAGAGNQAFFEMINGTSFLGYETAAWTNWATRGAITDYTSVYPQIIEAHMRLMRTSTNVYTPSVSRDGQTFIDLATISVTMTPSHVGIAASTFGGSGTTAWSFDYFRVI